MINIQRPASDREPVQPAQTHSRTNTPLCEVDLKLGDASDDGQEQLPRCATFRAEIRDRIESRMREMADGIALAYQLTCKVEYTRLLDATINHSESTRHAQAAAAAIVGEANVKELTPVMGGEDFGGFLLERPGAFMAIGQAEAYSASPHSQGVHSPFYDFNDAIIPTAASYFAELAERRLPID